jgi:hypothetical protein
MDLATAIRLPLRIGRLPMQRRLAAILAIDAVGGGGLPGQEGSFKTALTIRDSWRFLVGPAGRQV